MPGKWATTKISRMAGHIIKTQEDLDIAEALLGLRGQVGMEDRGQKTEDREQIAENRGLGRRSGPEIGGQRTGTGRKS